MGFNTAFFGVKQTPQLYIHVLWLGLPSCLCHVCSVFRHIWATQLYIHVLWLGLPSCLCHVCSVFRYIWATSKEFSIKQIEVCKFYVHYDLHINTDFEIRYGFYG